MASSRKKQISSNDNNGILPSNNIDLQNNRNTLHLSNKRKKLKDPNEPQKYIMMEK
jgi:hypothetical protein